MTRKYIDNFLGYEEESGYVSFYIKEKSTVQES